MMIELCSGFSDCNVGVDLGGDTKETRSSKRLKRPKSQSQQSGYEDDGVDLGGEDYSSLSRSGSSSSSNRAQPTARSGPPDR